jgi:hypothetical protein
MPKMDHILRWQQVLVQAAGKLARTVAAARTDATAAAAAAVEEAALAAGLPKDLERRVQGLVPVAAVASLDTAASQDIAAAAAAAAGEAYRTFAARDSAVPVVPAAVPRPVPRTSRHSERHTLGLGLLVPVERLQAGQMDCSPWFKVKTQISVSTRKLTDTLLLR